MREKGCIVTFYTYKGGIGRTMAVANVAWRLATRHGLRVVVVDWDLEAPSLHQYFSLDGGAGGESLNKDGVIEFLLAWKQVRPSKKVPDKLSKPIAFKQQYLQRVFATGETLEPEIWLMAAGRVSLPNYPEKLVSLDLQRMGKRVWERVEPSEAGRTESRTDTNGLSAPSSKLTIAIRTLADLLTSNADIVLVDSRTGLTDIGWVCTAMLPDAVFMLTAPNEQSWNGLMSAASNVRPRDVRGIRDTTRPVWIGVSRVPLVGELEATDRWLDQSEKLFELGARDAAEGNLWDSHDHPDGLRTFLVPHNGRWTVGQRILKPPTAAPDDYLSRAFDRIAEALNVWVRRPAMIRYSKQETRHVLKSIEQELAKAMRRRDHQSCCHFYYLLGVLNFRLGKSEMARQAFECTATMALGRRDRELLSLTLECLGRLDKAHISRESAAPWNGDDVRDGLSKSLTIEIQREESFLEERRREFEKNLRKYEQEDGRSEEQGKVEKKTETSQCGLETRKDYLLTRTGLPAPSELV